ncbi:Uncharacterized conserved protein, DUF885 familyt [Eubacterium ruminantium]|uniref:Uncharacterized conserved protein, DUF885 familyt n=1 Tax=Eubacterium ruminantium TaxID=42322 RepID=A0A1T4MNA5_9FIRM|nr:DUF885 domain-containing protein [Eubacterium ruminantium]SCW49314.1 Uncharacterized conserved protein, DUF885 familyt [Eubacterium ruminantium]SDM59976.1 Uncharacterized conserved protein, DUF885 familyt [Eubacterium ruminantium]SJZ68590.1 Uncharacterized conserved protein, DUF885 familyt [Eubacterium ruminantium]
MFKKKIKGRISLILVAMLMATAGCGKKGKNSKKVEDNKEANVVTESQFTGEDIEIPTTEFASSGDSSIIKAVSYADKKNDDFEKYIDEEFVNQVTSSTIAYHDCITNGDNFGITKPKDVKWDEDKVGDTVEEWIENELKGIEESYDKLIKFEGAKLTEDEYLTFLVYKRQLEITKAGIKYSEFISPFFPGRGIQAETGEALMEYRFNNKEDVDDYIELMNKYPDYVDQNVKYEKWRNEKGYVLPEAMIDRAITQCDDFLAEKENNYVIVEFNGKIDAADFLTADEKEEYKKKNVKAMENVFEGYETIKKTLEESRSQSVNKAVAEYENGKDYYNEYIIPYFASTDKTGDELCAEFDKRAQEIADEMSTIAEQYPDETEYFYNHVQDAFKDIDTKDVEEIVNIAMDKTLDNYPVIDKMQFKASYLSEVSSKILSNTLAYYLIPTLDEPDNNIIRVNSNTSSGMWGTLTHEGCPGHMYQFNYFRSTDASKLRKISLPLGYIEGWAVYASYNAYDDYDYPDMENDAVIGTLFRLNDERNYLINERIELGVNYEGWSAEDMVKYLSDVHYINALEEGSDEYNQMVAAFEEQRKGILAGDPGLLLSYSQGYNEMRNLREYAKEKLGDKFNIVEYHKAVLDAGPCYYDILKEQVDEYINETLSK